MYSVCAATEPSPYRSLTRVIATETVSTLIMEVSCSTCSFVFVISDDSASEEKCPSCGTLCRSTLPFGNRSGTNVDPTLIVDGQSQTTGVSPATAGRYDVLRLIASGGFGQVFLARDTLLGRDVALKVPNERRLADERDRARFLEEAKLAASLHHPGIVTVYDAAMSVDECYIAMEFVEDETLRDALKSRRFSIDETVSVISDVARAIHYAHTKGLVHRDLKPSNILISREGAPRITDFGLAVTDVSQHLLKGEIAGTPAYMPPEQVQGLTHQLDGRADIWSIGVIFYEMLTGRRPFSGPEKRVFDEIISRSPRPPRQINDQIPAELESVCLRCLQKSPNLRFTTALDIAEALSGQSEPTAPRPAEADPSPGRSQNNMAIAAAVVLLLSLLFLLRSESSQNASLVAKVASRRQKLAAIETDLAPSIRRLNPGQWHNLLKQSPSVLYWLPNDETSRWNWDHDRHEISVDSDEIAMFGCGQTTANEFEFGVSIQKNSWTGFVGCFWGYNTYQRPNGERAAKCNAIVIRARSETEVFMQRSIYDIVYDKRIPLHNYEVVSPPVPVKIYGAKPTILTVHVAGNSVRSVEWNGAKLPQLSDAERGSAIKAVPSSGQIGVVNYDGATGFSGIQIRLTRLKGESHE